MNAAEIKTMFSQDIKKVNSGRGEYVQINILGKNTVTVKQHLKGDKDPTLTSHYDSAFILVLYYKSKEPELNVAIGNGVHNACVYEKNWSIMVTT